MSINFLEEHYRSETNGPNNANDAKMYTAQHYTLRYTLHEALHEALRQA